SRHTCRAGRRPSGSSCGAGWLPRALPWRIQPGDPGISGSPAKPATGSSASASRREGIHMPGGRGRAPCLLVSGAVPTVSGSVEADVLTTLSDLVLAFQGKHEVAVEPKTVLDVAPGRTDITARILPGSLIAVRVKAE